MTRVAGMELYIVGGGGHGSDVADLALRCGITPAGVADDRRIRDGRFTDRGIPVTGTIMDVPERGDWGDPHTCWRIRPRPRR